MQGLAALQPSASSAGCAAAEPGGPSEEGGETTELDSELHRFRVVHHLRQVPRSGDLGFLLPPIWGGCIVPPGR